jgi:hypothetical protein
MKKAMISFATAVFITSLALVAPNTSSATSPEIVWASSAEATSHYVGYEPSYAAGAPDATSCGDHTGQAWTYGNPKVDSELEVVFDEPVDATALQIFFSNDYVDLLTIYIEYEGASYFPFTSINGIDGLGTPLTCGGNADSAYPNDIKVEYPIELGNSKITKIKLVMQTDYAWPQVDAIGLVKDIYTKPAFTTKPVVYGKAKVGKFFGAGFNATGNPYPSSKYQWFACTKPGTKFVTKKPSDCTSLSGENSEDLKIKKALKGKYVRVRITLENSVKSATYFSKTTTKIS